MARTIALCNQKGGVGKTTTAFHLARAGVLAGRRVLLVDADPQGNATAAAAREPVEDTQIGLADAMSERTDESLREVTVPGIWDGLDIAPTSGTMLEGVRDELVIGGTGREYRMREQIKKLQADYDLILIDCAPSLDQLTINGLVAADSVLVVTQSKQFSANGIEKLLATIDGVRSYYHDDLGIAGVLVNQHEENTVSGRTWLGELTEAVEARGIAVLAPPIPKKVVVSDTVEASIGLDEWGSADATVLGEVFAKHLAAIEGAML
ncbi:ParA family protein [Tomitella gaofuii]|uniref:ParA family protein n=1 Tax=Tomitella gaofuii TaxID=2760083 RepID=UPI0015FC7944|nr:ParA family protein [Tomitella gaofuii]